MKFFDKLHLGKQEQAQIKKFFQISIIICIILAVGFWAVQRLSLSKNAANRNSLLGEGLPFGGSGNAMLLPIDIEAHQWAADYYLRIDAPQKAIDHLLRIFPQKSTDRALALQLATAYIQARQYENAYRMLRDLSEQKARDQYADSIEARLGLTLMYLGKYDEAKKQLEQCLAAGKRSAEAACYLGQVEAMIQSPSDTAEQYLLKAIDWDPHNVEAWYQLARYYMSIGKYEKSRTHLLQVLEMQPLYEKAHSRLGMAYYYLNQPELAEKSYHTALALNPGDFNTQYNLGELYYTLFGNPAKAAEEFKKALNADSMHIEANFKLGLIKLANNEIPQAIRLFERARKASPQNTRILLQLGVAYEKNNSPREALQVYDFINGYDPLNEIAVQKIKLLGGNANTPAIKKQSIGTDSPEKRAVGDENSEYFEPEQKSSPKSAD
jgi:tetratricopeptide (TPR) repeat protein